jgi:hypothetical protein
VAFAASSPSSTAARVVIADTAETLQEQVDRRVAPRRLL